VKGETTLPDRGAGGRGISAVGALVRQHDRDRYQTALFAPAARRESLFALYAFNYEVARVRESVTTPMLGQIRLQWWREVIDAAYAGAPARRHVVAAPLTAMIRDLSPSRALFDRLIDAREQDLADEPPATMALLEDYVQATSATLSSLALQILGDLSSDDPHPNPPPLAGGEAIVASRRPNPPPQAGEGRVRVGPECEGLSAVAHHVGVAYALAGLLRALPFHARAGRCYIPQDLAVRVGLDRQDYARLRPDPGLRQAVAALADCAAEHLRLARAQRAPVPRAALPALLPAIVAERALARLRRAAWNPFDPSVAMPDPLLTWRLAMAMLRRRF
jgi:phytoene synthase